jgi:hypothetical protein
MLGWTNVQCCCNPGSALADDFVQGQGDADHAMLALGTGRDLDPAAMALDNPA